LLSNGSTCTAYTAAEQANDEVLEGLALEVARAKIDAEEAAATAAAAVARAESQRAEALAAAALHDQQRRKLDADSARAEQLTLEVAKLKSQLTSEVAKLKSKLKAGKKENEREVCELRAALDDARQRSAEDQIELLKWAQITRVGDKEGGNGSNGEGDGDGDGDDNATVASRGDGEGGSGGEGSVENGVDDGATTTTTAAAAAAPVSEIEVPANILQQMQQTLAASREVEVAAAAALAAAEAKLDALLPETEALRKRVARVGLYKVNPVDP
jgi:hypothetical protein